MFVPILILMLGFTTHESTGLAQSLMVGGTLAGLVLNWNQRHPVANRPLIDVTMVSYISKYITLHHLSGLIAGPNANSGCQSWSNHKSYASQLADHRFHRSCPRIHWV